MVEKVGKITLDYSHYPGEDFYCDGEIEKELLEIAKNYPASEFPRIIEEKKSWPVLYHLSDLRENIVEWLPMDKSMKVLEVLILQENCHFKMPFYKYILGRESLEKYGSSHTN